MWLAPGSPAATVIHSYLRKPNVEKTLKKLAGGCHTGSLENFHSLITLYAPKRVKLDPDCYEAKVGLAILDHNENCSRAPVRGELQLWISLLTRGLYHFIVFSALLSGPDGKLKLRLEWSKQVKAWRLRRKYPAKSYQFISELMYIVQQRATVATSRKYQVCRLTNNFYVEIVCSVA